MSGSKELFEAQEYDGSENKLYCLKHAMNNLFNQEDDENPGKGWLEVDEFIDASRHLNKENPARQIRDRNWGTDEAFRLVNHKNFRLFDDEEESELMRLIEVPHDIYLKSKKDMSTFFNKMFLELQEKYMGATGVYKFIRGFLVNQNGNHWVCYRLKYDGNAPYLSYLYKDSMKNGPREMHERDLKKVFLDIAMTNKKLPVGTPFRNIMVLFHYQYVQPKEFDRRPSKIFPMETFTNIKVSNTSSKSNFHCLLCEYLGHNMYHQNESHAHTPQCIMAFEQFLQSENN